MRRFNEMYVGLYVLPLVADESKKLYQMSNTRMSYLWDCGLLSWKRCPHVLQQNANYNFFQSFHYPRKMTFYMDTMSDIADSLELSHSFAHVDKAI